MPPVEGKTQEIEYISRVFLHGYELRFLFVQFESVQFNPVFDLRLELECGLLTLECENRVVSIAHDQGALARIAFQEIGRAHV